LLSFSHLYHLSPSELDCIKNSLQIEHLSTWPEWRKRNKPYRITMSSSLFFFRIPCHKHPFFPTSFPFHDNNSLCRICSRRGPCWNNQEEM
jgi:hypothetical protein